MNSMSLFRIRSYVNGSRKSKMAAGILEIIIYQLLDNISTPIQTANPPFSGSRNSMALFRISSDVTGSQKSKMAVDKPEILICQLLDKIGKKFQRLNRHFSLNCLLSTPQVCPIGLTSLTSQALLGILMYDDYGGSHHKSQP